MSHKAQTVRVGIFTVVSLALLAFVLVTFAGMRFWEGRDRYHIVFTSSVMGLEKGARVFLNGTRVGSVEEIALDKQDLRNVIVTIAVKEGTPIHTNTEAMLQFAGITGLKVLDLRNGTTDSPVLPPGGTIAKGETLLERLEGRAEDLAEQTTQLMTKANRVMDQLEGVDAVMAEAKVAAANLAEASGSLKEMVAENRSGLRASLAAVQRTAQSAGELLDGQLPQLVANADSLVTDVKGIVHRNDTALRTAMFDLKQASRTFKDLAREVRQRPSRLLFSSPPSERKLP